jgi:arginyl-tRNA synthetase
MVELPSGRMKSREGTVVDADDLMQEVIHEVSIMSEERGEITSLAKEEQEDILRKIGLGALKFFMIKVQPRKKMIFDPRESVDIHGQTGPYIQNAYVRIQSVLRKASQNQSVISVPEYVGILDQERIILRQLLQYPEVVREAGEQYDPSSIANYCYALAKEFHKFYHDVRILNAESDAAKSFRLNLCSMTGSVLRHGFYLLGIEMPDRM